MPSVKYVAQPTLKIDGQDASASLIEDILELSVEESLHLPGMFTLIVNNPAVPGITKDSIWKHAKLFKIGKSIKIGFAAATTSATEFNAANQGTVFDGEITAIEAHFSDTAEAPMIIRGYDKSHRLHRGRFNRSFQNMTDTDILKKIIGEVGISAGTMDSSGSPHDYVFQENQTNMQFFRERAARNGFELFVQDSKLNFRKPSSSTTLTLTWLKELTSFNVRVSSAEQVSSVEVRGWDYKKKEPIVSTKSSAQVLTAIAAGAGKKQSNVFQGFPSSPKLTVVDQPVTSSSEADAIAQALMNELGGEFVQADAKADGNPKIRPGRLVKLAKMGGDYDGDYYVTATRHLYQSRTYKTEFSIRGLRSGDLFTTLTPVTKLQPGQTLLVGLVTNNNDPDKLGRVRVHFPTLTMDHESNWARVVAIGAGGTRGFDCLPEVGDEVLVAFEHGDIHRPYIIGNVWNGTDKPPTAVANSVVGGKVRLRTFQSRVGHYLQFVEEDKDSSKKGLSLKTIGGHLLYCNDSDKKIELKSNGGNLVELDDAAKKITVKTSNGNSCVIDGQSNKITVDSKGTIEIKASQTITLKVGGNSIEISNTGITLKAGSSKIEIQAASLNAESSGTTTVKGTSTTVSGTASMTVKGAATKVSGDGMVTVSAPLVSIG